MINRILIPNLKKIVWLLFFIFGSCSTSSTIKTVPLPALNSNLRLSVAYAINPRLPQMSDAQLSELLQETRRVVKDHFKVDVDFGPVHKIPLAALFQSIPEGLKQNQKSAIFDFKNGSGDISRLTKAMADGLKINTSYSVAELIQQAQPFLETEIPEETIEGLASALVETLLARIHYWQKIKATDGQPILDQSPYNEWAMWDILGYGDLSFDIVLTNQLIASIEYYGQELHSAIRGGIVAGTTSYSKKGQFGTYIAWSTFLYSNNFEMLTKTREGELYSDEEAAKLSGAYLAHEIGHQLFHFGHPYGNKACVMKPIEMLKFREWYKNIDSSKCAIGSIPTMEPGSIQIQYVDLPDA